MVYAPDLVPEDPMPALVRRIEALERRLTEVGSADVLRTAGVLAQPDVLRILGSLIVDGTLRVTGAAEILGTLSLPAGIIGNDALSNPVIPGDIAVEETGWTNSALGAGGVKATTTLTAPDGCTKGLVTVNMYAQADHGAGEDYMRLYPEIGGTQGRPGGKIVHSGAGDQVNISMTKLVVSTSIAVNARLWTSWAVGAHAENIATITGSVLWLR